MPGIRRPAAIMLLAVTLHASAQATPPVGTRYLHTDHRGDVVLETDGEGRAVARHVHRPFGERDRRTAGVSGTPRTYDGWERDGETSLHYAGARHYDPQLGRFSSVDPLRQAVYVANRDAPLEFVDPDGRGWFKLMAEGGQEAAFILNEATGRYERTPNTVAVSAGWRVPADPDDVFIAGKSDKSKYWRKEFMNGVRRDWVTSRDTRDRLIEAYIRKYSLPDEAARDVKGQIHIWARNYRLVEPGSSSKSRAGADSQRDQPPAKRRRTGANQLPATSARIPVASATISRTPVPRRGVEIVRPRPIRAVPPSVVTNQPRGRGGRAETFLPAAPAPVFLDAEFWGLPAALYPHLPAPWFARE